MDWLKDLDPVKVLLWVAPGAFISMFRSFFLKGSFPTIGKDDLAAFVLGSVVYRFLVLGFLTQEGIAKLSTNGWFWFFFVGVGPSVLGFGLGMLEASDWIGQLVRSWGVIMPTPTPSAWNTVFRALPADTFVIAVLKDGTTFYGRWAKGSVPSSASSDGSNQDIYIGETGDLNAQGQYISSLPKRGVYVAASEVRTIEVITGSGR
jgi:hypothetical protein